MVMRYFLFAALVLSLLSAPLTSQAKSTADSVDISHYLSAAETTSKSISPWQRQLITINVRVNTNEEFSYLLFDNVKLNNVIIESRKIESQSLSDSKKFIKQIRIYIWPLEPGTQSLSLPAVKLILSGRVIKKINIEPLNLQVKALPAYLPPGFPVGTIGLDSHYYSADILSFILKPGDLANYVLKITTSGIHPSLIPDYSVYLDNAAITRLATAQLTVSEMLDQQYRYTKQYDIPVVSHSNGMNKFDDFRVLYFEPQSGKINSLNYSPAILLTLNNTLQLVIVLFVVSLVCYLLYGIYGVVSRIAARRRIWKNIYQSTGPDELSAALRKIPAGYKLFKQSKPNSVNIGLEAWVQTWRDETLTTAIKPLLTLQFAKLPAENFADTKQVIISRLQHLDNMIFYLNLPDI
ncbi:MAG: hypothetical protein OEY29_13345 [Gammaproteobacteria bacterium]|nr:hypothetical protein [Gammaproteobacteria bacterium]